MLFRKVLLKSNKHAHNGPHLCACMCKSLALDGLFKKQHCTFCLAENSSTSALLPVLPEPVPDIDLACCWTMVASK